MIRFSTYFFGGLIIALGTVLFQVKYTVVDLETLHRQLKREICSKSEEIHVLNAEWAYLNSSARLKELASKHLKLSPIKGDQMASYASLQNSGLGEYDREALDYLLERIDKNSKEKAPVAKTIQKKK